MGMGMGMGAAAAIGAMTGAIENAAMAAQGAYYTAMPAVPASFPCPVPGMFPSGSAQVLSEDLL